MKTYKLPCYDIVVITDEQGSGSITSDLKERCDFCGELDCDMFCEEAQEDMSDRDPDMQESKREDLQEKSNYNDQMDVVEQFVLSCACQGIDIETPAFLAAIEDTVQGCANNVRG